MTDKNTEQNDTEQKRQALTKEEADAKRRNVVDDVKLTDKPEHAERLVNKDKDREPETAEEVQSREDREQLGRDNVKTLTSNDVPPGIIARDGNDPDHPNNPHNDLLTDGTDAPSKRDNRRPMAPNTTGEMSDEDRILAAKDRP